MVDIHYKIITSKYYPPSSSYQCSNFSSMIKNKTDGYVYVNTDDNYSFDDFYFDSRKIYINEWDLIDKISKQASIPSNTIVDISFYSKIYVDEFKNYTKANYDYNSLSFEYGYDYNFPIFYAYVDLSKDPVFNNINNTQLDSERDKKYLEIKLRVLIQLLIVLIIKIWKQKRNLII